MTRPTSNTLQPVTQLVHRGPQALLLEQRMLLLIEKKAIFRQTPTSAVAVPAVPGAPMQGLSESCDGKPCVRFCFCAAF